MNYYNEHDPKASAWLRELISAGLIPNGHVDERSIVDVQPSDLNGFTQCHFFAGIGGWAYALQIAGWDSARPVWTGSCPCQPFSVAGKRKGNADKRHLWPEWFRLIRECKPTTIFGEQVASPDALRWWDGVSDDLEGAGYACGAADLCAAGVGAPHIRQRIYWVADMHSERRNGRSEGIESKERTSSRFESRCATSGLDDMRGTRLEGRTEQPAREERQAAERSGDAGRVVQPNGTGCEQGIATAEAARYGGAVESAGDANAWSNFDIIQCLDGKARRVEPGSFPLAHGVPGRVGLLRGYGNAIVPQVAAEFVKAYITL